MNGSKPLLQKLTMLRDQTPKRLISVIRLIWPEIKAARTVGHTLKVIHESIEEGGIKISYRLFTVYVSRLRREESAATARKQRLLPQQNKPLLGVKERETAIQDPLANYQASCVENPPPTVNFEGGAPDKDKLI